MLKWPWLKGIVLAVSVPKPCSLVKVALYWQWASLSLLKWPWLKETVLAVGPTRPPPLPLLKWPLLQGIVLVVCPTSLDKEALVKGDSIGSGPHPPHLLLKWPWLQGIVLAVCVPTPCSLVKVALVHLTPPPFL